MAAKQDQKMIRKYLSLIFSAIWPGLGHLYLKKYLSGIAHFLIWFLLCSQFLRTFPQSILLDPTRKTRFLIWGSTLIFWVGILWHNWQLIKKQKEIKSSFLPLIPLFLLIFAFFFLCLPLKWRQPNAAIGNLHTHTTCSDGEGDYETIINLALKLKFDFIAITDHSFCPDLAAKCEKETRLLCFPGQEVSARVHVLAIGIKNVVHSNSPIPEIIRKIHQQGGIAIAAHPLGPGGIYTEEELINLDFDALECSGTTRTQHEYLKRLAQEYDRPCVYNSDTHEIEMLRTVYNVCDQKIENLADLKEAIKTNKCRQFIPIDLFLKELLNF